MKDKFKFNYIALLIISYFSGMGMTHAANYTNETISRGAAMQVSAGDTIKDSTINGGRLTIEAGGMAKNIMLSGEGEFYVNQGSESANNVISAGTQYVSGRDSHSTLEGNRAKQHVQRGGISESTLISSMGVQHIFDGGAAYNAIIEQNGFQDVLPGGKAYNSVVNGGTITAVGSTLTDITVNAGGYVSMSNGSTLTGGVVNQGNVAVADNSLIEEVTFNGGLLSVEGLKGTAATKNIVINGGFQNILVNGIAYATTINAAGRQEVHDGGVAQNTVINNGQQIVYSGGEAESSTINGGFTLLNSGAAATGTTRVNREGELIMNTGSRAINVNLDGGQLSVADLFDTTAGLDTAKIDNLTMADGRVRFLRGNDGDFATLSIGTLSGAGSFLMNTDITNRKGNFISVDHGSGSFGLQIVDSGKEISNTSDLTVNLVNDKTGNAEFSLESLRGRQTQAVDGGTYTYTLNKGVGKDGMTGNVWYLGTQYTAQGTKETSPATDAALSMANAGIKVIQSELDGLRTYRQNSTPGNNVWGHFLGGRTRVETSQSAAYRLDQEGMEIGADVKTDFDQGSLVTGGFMSVTGNSVKHERGGKSKIDSYGVGAYATWYDNRGFYVDGVLKGNRLNSHLNVRTTNGSAATGDWGQYGVSASLETGYPFSLTEQVEVEPYVRTTGAYINNANVTLSNGMNAALGKPKSLTVQAGARLKTRFTVGNTEVKPYLQAGVVQELAKSNKSTFNNRYSFDNNTDGTIGKYGAGVSINVTDNAAIYAEANYQRGSHVESPWQGMMGARISF